MCQKCLIFPPFADLKTAPKYGRSPSMTANPSPVGTPQRKAAEAQQSQVHRFSCCSSPIFYHENALFFKTFAIMCPTV